MAEKGIWLSLQPFPEEMADAFPRSRQEWAKAQEVLAETFYEEIDEHARLGGEVAVGRIERVDAERSAALSRQHDLPAARPRCRGR